MGIYRPFCTPPYGIDGSPFCMTSYNHGYMKVHFV